MFAPAVVSVLVWLWLASFRGMFWRTDVRLPRLGADPVRWPSVAVVVPARDEAAILPGTLPTLLAQDYPGPVRLILVDDNSGDGTRELVASRWPRFEVVAPGEPAAGWAGKLWALRAGIGEAGPVDFLLLTDADIAHRPGSLSALVRAAEANRLDLRVADGPAARTHGLGTPGRAGVRLLLRDAVPVPVVQRAGRPHGGRGRWLFAGPPGGAGPRRRPGSDPHRGDRRRRAGRAPEARRLANVPRARGSAGVGPAVRRPGSTCGDGLPQRVRPAAPLGCSC